MCCAKLPCVPGRACGPANSMSDERVSCRAASSRCGEQSRSRTPTSSAWTLSALRSCGTYSEKALFCIKPLQLTGGLPGVQH